MTRFAQRSGTVRKGLSFAFDFVASDFFAPATEAIQNVAVIRRPFTKVPRRKDKRGADLISDSKIIPGGTAALHACGLGAVYFSVVNRPVFDCRMANAPATINKESTNENNTDVDHWVDARRLRINGKPCT